MKKIIVMLFIAALIFSASFVSAEGLYVSGDLGATLTGDSSFTAPGEKIDFDFETGLLVNGAVGMDLGNNVRVEGEIGYQTADVDRISKGGEAFDGGDNINVLSFLINGYYDIPMDAPVTPFISGGIGFANVQLEDDDGGRDADDSVFAYQIGAGLGYVVDEQITVDCGYRYMATSDPEFDIQGSTGDAEYGSHNFYVGVRFAIQ